MNDLPDDDEPVADERQPLDPDQLAFLTRHMGRVIGGEEWGAALSQPKKPAGER